MALQELLKPVGLLFLICFVAEFLWARRAGRPVFDKGEVGANFGVFFGNQLLAPLSQAWKLFLFSILEPFQLIHLPVNLATALLTLVVVEFAYYLYHRASHEVPLLWAIHQAHHSSTHMNLTTAIRLNWLGGFVGPLFFTPLVLLGFSAKLVFGSLLLGLLYQFFLHTQAVGKLGALEGLLLNTPAAHRVHHGSNPRYLDRNYGGMLIVFDRWLGTYEPESEPVRYGITTGKVAANPFVIVFGPLVALLRRKFA